MMVKVPTNGHEVSASDLQALTVSKIANWLGFVLWATSMSNPVNPNEISTDAGKLSTTDFGILEVLEIAGHRV